MKPAGATAAKDTRNQWKIVQKLGQLAIYKQAFGVWKSQKSLEGYHSNPRKSKENQGKHWKTYASHGASKLVSPKQVAHWELCDWRLFARKEKITCPKLLPLIFCSWGCCLGLLFAWGGGGRAPTREVGAFRERSWHQGLMLGLQFACLTFWRSCWIFLPESSESLSLATLGQVRSWLRGRPASDSFLEVPGWFLFIKLIRSKP